MSLSDKIYEQEFPYIDIIKAEDVREAVRKLQTKWLMMEFSDLPEENSEMRVKEIIKEVFGDKLI